MKKQLDIGVTKWRFIVVMTVMAMFFCSCRHSGKHEIHDADNEVEIASGLNISHYRNFTLVKIKNPWREGAMLQIYALVPRDSLLPDDIPDDAIVVRTPVKSALVYSSVHGGVIKELGEVQSITGVCDLEYFNMPEVITGVKEGRIVDAGKSVSPTVEKIMSFMPEVIILSPFQNGGYGILANLGIPIIECADYMENTPVGRAEWIKLFGELYDKRAEADSIFNSVKDKYDSLRSVASMTKERPKVISETVMSGVWYVPGGSSYMAHFYVDAGAEYPWADNNSAGSLSLDFAQVYDKAGDADFWLIRSTTQMTRESFVKSNPLNGKFKACKDGNVYQCCTLETTLFQDFPFHPEILLEEYIKIFHPGMLPGDLKYFAPLSDE